MNSKGLGKKVFVLIFLLVILAGVFIAQDDSFSKGYLGWLKTKIMGLGPELNLAEEDSGLDMTSIDIGALLDRGVEEESIVEEDDELENLAMVIDAEENTSEELVVTSNSVQEELLRIQAEIDKITEEVDRIATEVQILLASQGITQNL